MVSAMDLKSCKQVLAAQVSIEEEFLTTFKVRIREINCTELILSNLSGNTTQEKPPTSKRSNYTA